MTTLQCDGVIEICAKAFGFPRARSSIVRKQTICKLLEVPELASTNEGPIPVRRGTSGVLVPDRSVYRVILVPTSPTGVAATRLAGRVVIEAPPRSAVDLVYRKALSLVLPESAL